MGGCQEGPVVPFEEVRLDPRDTYCKMSTYTFHLLLLIRQWVVPGPTPQGWGHVQFPQVLGLAVCGCIFETCGFLFVVMAIARCLTPHTPKALNIPSTIDVVFKAKSGTHKTLLHTHCWQVSFQLHDS